jgi:peptide chain release factor 2
MRAEIEAIANDINQSIELLRRHLDWDNALRRLDELNARSEDPDLWNDAAAAQKVMRERTHLEQSTSMVRTIERERDDFLGLIELGEMEDDQTVVADAEEGLRALRDRARKMELESLLSGEADSNDCYIEVHAGAGGTEAQDWAEILLRMYTRWAEQHGYKVVWLEETAAKRPASSRRRFRSAGTTPMAG